MTDVYTGGDNCTMEPILDEEQQKEIKEEEAKIKAKKEARRLDSAAKYVLEMPEKSTASLYVYSYDEDINRFTPYRMEKIKKSQNFPTVELNRMLDEMADHGKPPKIDRVLWVLAFSFLITVVYIAVVELIEWLDNENTTLHVLLWTIASIPIGLLCIMVLVACVAFMNIFGRRNSLNLTAELRNREYFNPIGINVVFSQNYDWFCIEIRNQRMLAENMTISRKKKDDHGRRQSIMDHVGDDQFDF